jgi:CoA-transferase family III
VGSWALAASVLSHARQVGATIEDRVRALGGRQIRVDAEEIIAGRAALLGLDPPARISAGGASRLLAGPDGWCALTLSHAEDFETIPALVELPAVTGDPWSPLAAAAVTRSVAEFVARARLLDMPAAVLGEVPASEPNIMRHNAPSPPTLRDLLVVDLSSMWAGPLCGRLLAAAGATVVKVETPARPDGTRSGDRQFFDWMNSEKLSFSTSFDTYELVRLLRAADIVIEGSRPAALVRRGLSAERVPARPGRIWLRISGYGSEHPDWVAFGDDAAVAGGLVVARDDGPVFCGDALADPLTGLAATAAVVDAMAWGGGVIIDVSMAAVAATYADAIDGELDDCRPRLPELPAHPAHELGADNTRIRDLIEARLAAC